MLRVKSIAHMSPKVLTIDAGMAMAAMRVERQFLRNTSTTRAARNAPTTRCSCTVCTAASMYSDSSRTVSIA